MQLSVANHRYGDVVLEAHFGPEWHEIRHVLEGCPAPQSTVSGSGLSAMEDWISNGLMASGWEPQASIRVDASGRSLDTSLRCDFAKNGAFVEVEFGHEDALFRDLFKFLVAGRCGVAEVGVLVVATESLAAMLDADCATFEQALEIGRYRYGGIATPFVVVGLGGESHPARDALTLASGCQT